MDDTRAVDDDARRAAFFEAFNRQPRWLQALNGAGDPGAVWIDHFEANERLAPKPDDGYRSGTWVMEFRMPEDVREAAEATDPIFIAMGFSDCIRRLEERVEQSVILAREAGKSWEIIGKALGVSRQAAWERYAKKVDPPS